MIKKEIKICSRCKQKKDTSLFAKDKYNNDGFTSACKECRNKQYNEYYKNNPEKQKEKNDSQQDNRKRFYASPKGIESSRRSHLKRNYNMTLEEYNEKLELQESKCEGCGSDHSYDKYGVLAVDHCHTTGKNRGLLCFKCNAALGCINDNIETLKKLIKYLNKYKNEEVR